MLLLVDRPGCLRDALASLVGAMPGLAPLLIAASGLLALKVLHEVRPRLVLIEGGLPEAEVLELLCQIKQNGPRSVAWSWPKAPLVGNWRWRTARTRF